MKFATGAAMRRIEELEQMKGVSYYQMMCDAGNRAADLLGARFDFSGKRITLLCGRGNNGGDGFVVASRLERRGAKVTVALVNGKPATEAAAAAFAALPPAVRVVTLPTPNMTGLLFTDYLIDAVYGIGFHGEPGDKEKLLFGLCAESSAFKISLDLPSGVEADNGQYVSCFKADLTVAMSVYKPAHLVSWREAFAGELLLAETPLTVAALQGGLLLHSLEAGLCSLPVRTPWSHKGNNGRLAVVCGSRAFPGAAVLACCGALRSGAGYVQLLSTQHVCNLVAAHFPEVLYTPLPENAEGGIDRMAAPALLAALERCDAVLMGCGLGNTPHTGELVQAVLSGCKKPLLLDADGLNALEGHTERLRAAACPMVLTPHPGEFFRLARAHIDSTKEDYTLAAARLSAEADVTLLLKGAVTGIFRGKRQPVFSFEGNDGLAKGGSGDLLSGIIASLLAQGAPPDEATLCGAWLHARSASLAARELNHRWLQPSDVADYLEEAITELENQPARPPQTGGGVLGEKKI